jgi:type II secretory pathway component GspD/PulD (secretin)
MRLTIVPPTPKGKSLIVTGYAHRMPRIQALLNIVDEPGEVKEFRFRELRYTMAEALAPKLQALAEQLGTISITVSQTSQPTRTTPTTTVRKPGESTTAYEARRRAEAAARARAAQARSRTTTTTPPPTPEKPTVFLDSDERTNRILMIGLSEQLDEVEELIDTLDVVQQDLRTLELYRLEHVDAEDVRNKLEELGIITPRLSTSPYSSRITGAKPSTTTTGTTATARQPISSRTQRYGEQEEEPGERPQVVVIEQTNSLLVNATAEQHEKVARILTYIDSEMLESDVPVQIYPLENQSPEHVKGLLDPLVEEAILDKEGKIQEVRNKQEDVVEIVADPNTFSLIVYASKRNQDWIGGLIEKLDQRRSQVLIDVTLVEISKSDAFNYDLNILSSFPDLVSTSGLTGAIMSATEGGSLVEKLLESDRDHFVDFQANGGRGAGFYGDKHINALLTAMQQKDYGRVLAKPKILVNDNEEGKIKTEDVTYVTRETSTIIEGVQNAIPTATEFQPFDAGIELTIIPHISRGGFLRLDIELIRDDFGTITGLKPPDTTGSTVDTTVTVPDGSTIILGGMLKLNQSKGGTKVPILGDLPLLGGLFRSTSNSDIQRNLYVFVKAEIIRAPETGLAQVDLERISERNRTAFEERESEFQQYHDWPGVKPKSMKPLKVLDAQ